MRVFISVVDQFIKLTKAYDILRDPERRKEYDETIRAKIAARKRREEMDAKRQQGVKGII